jgi:hypothetical protein
MKGGPLSPRDRRALRFLLLAAAPILLNVAVLQPYRRMHGELQEQILSERGLLERESALLRDHESDRSALRSSQAALDSARTRLFHAGSRALAVAAITEYVEQIASLSDITLHALEGADQDSVTSAFHRARLNVRGSGDLESFLRFVHRLELGPLLLRVHELTLRPQGGQHAARYVGEAVTAAPGDLEFGIRIDGFITPVVAHALAEAGS